MPKNLLKKWKKAKNTVEFTKDTGSVNLLNQLSVAYLHNNTDTSLYFAKQAYQLAKEQFFSVGQIQSFINIGNAYYVKGDYSSALRAAEQSMACSNEVNYSYGKARAYQIIGLTYLAQNRYNEAIVDFTNGVKIFSQLKDSSRADKAYFNLALSYDEGGQPEKSFYYLNKAFEIAMRIKDHDLITMTLNRNGEVNFHLKNYDKAFKEYQQVISLSYSSAWELDFAYSGIAQVYYIKGNYNQAILNAAKGLELSEKVSSLSDAVRALEILSKSYAAKKNYKKAYSYQVEFKKLNDSIFNSDKEKEVNMLHLKQQRADNIRLEMI